MSAFLDKFLREDRFGALIGNRVHFGLFGKHPVYGDFLRKNLDTGSLAMAHTSLFEEGIKSQISFWGKSAEAIDFDHCFLWRRAEQSILGRLWQSQDTHGRADYPMVFCLHTVSVPTAWALEKLLPKVEEFKHRSAQARTLEEVFGTYKSMKREIGDLVATAPMENSSRSPVATARAALMAHPAVGPAQEKLVRIMGLLAAGLPRCADSPGSMLRQLPARRSAVSKKTSVRERSTQHIRVPAGASSAREALMQWSEFIGYLIGWSAPVLFVFPVSRDWLDILLGEPSPNQFRFLKTSAKETGLAGDGGPETEPDFRDAAQRLLSDYVKLRRPGPSPVQRWIRALGFILAPLLAGVALASYLRISQPENIPTFLHDLAHRLGNPHVQSPP